MSADQQDQPLTTVGGLRIETGNQRTEVAVTGGGAGIEITLTVGNMTMDALLLPEDAERVRDDLDAAIDSVDPVKAEQARGWVPDEYQE